MATETDLSDFSNKIKSLPDPVPVRSSDLATLLKQRRSIRSFQSLPLSDQEISQLLFAAQGITEKHSNLRTAPSAGATYPLETYLMTPEGLWHYLPARHALRLVKSGDLRKLLASAALGQSAIEQAPATIIFTAIYTRTTNRYRERGIRYVHIEVGHAAQNVHLMAVALGLGSVPIGAFDDEAVAGLIGINNIEKVLYLIPIGRAK